MIRFDGYPFIQLVDGLAVSAWDQVPVDVHGYLVRTVSDLISNIGQTFALLDQGRRESVSEIVKTNTSNLRIGKKLVDNLA